MCLFCGSGTFADGGNHGEQCGLGAARLGSLLCAENSAWSIAGGRVRVAEASGRTHGVSGMQVGRAWLDASFERGVDASGGAVGSEAPRRSAKRNI